MATLASSLNGEVASKLPVISAAPVAAEGAAAAVAPSAAGEEEAAARHHDEQIEVAQRAHASRTIQLFLRYLVAKRQYRQRSQALLSERMRMTTILELNKVKGAQRLVEDAESERLEAVSKKLDECRPSLERLLHVPRRIAATRVLVLAPTRELASQCVEMGQQLSRFTDVRMCLVVGGLSVKLQVRRGGLASGR